MSWNYRIATKIFSYKEKFKDTNEKLAEHPDTRLFSVIEVYYDDDGTPNGYMPKSNVLADWESLEDLASTYRLIEAAFDKPILDLDNFPNVWEKPEPRELTKEERMQLTRSILKNCKKF